MFSVKSNSEEKVMLTLNPVSAAGNPAKLDGVPTWTLLEGDATIVPSEDGLSCELISGLPDMVNIIEISADADLDEDEIRTVTELINYEVTSPEANNLGINAVISPK